MQKLSVVELNKSPDALETLWLDHAYVMLDFFAHWCEPCKWADPVINQTLTKLSVPVLLVKVDIDMMPSLAENYSVMSVPTFILLKNKQELWRMRGFDVVSKMISSLEEAIDQN